MKRDYSIDVARGIACLLVIIGHIHSTPALLHTWVYSFHMPLFFAISGMVMKNEEPLSVFVIKRVNGLLLPYINLSIIVFFVDLLLKVAISFISNNPLDTKLLLQNMAGIIIGYRLTNYYYIMWFVLTSFFSLIAANIIVRVIKNQFIIFIISLLLVTANCILWKNNIVTGLPFSIDAVPIATAFILMGHSKICKTSVDFISRNYGAIIVTACLSVGSSLLSSKYLGDVDLYSCSVGGGTAVFN